MVFTTETSGNFLALKKTPCKLLTILLLFCFASTFAEEKEITMAEAQRRFILKRDLVTFLSLWQKNHFRYHASFDYNESTKKLSLYNSEKQLLAQGKAEKQGDRYIRTGIWKRYYPDGSLLGNISYSDNMRNGSATGYYQNGRVALKAEYTNGLYNGIVRRYDSSGRLLDTVEYTAGNPVSTDIKTMLVPSFQRPSHLPYGTLFEEKSDLWVHRDDKNDFITMWYRNGSLFCEVNTRNTGKEEETLHGKAVYWHENGAKWMEGQYSRGKAIGNWIFYNEDGIRREETASDRQFLQNSSDQ